jgi:hypothetical protein
MKDCGRIFFDGGFEKKEQNQFFEKLNKYLLMNMEISPQMMSLIFS